MATVRPGIVMPSRPIFLPRVGPGSAKPSWVSVFKAEFPNRVAGPRKPLIAVVIFGAVGLLIRFGPPREAAPDQPRAPASERHGARTPLTWPMVGPRTTERCPNETRSRHPCASAAHQQGQRVPALAPRGRRPPCRSRRSSGRASLGAARRLSRRGCTRRSRPLRPPARARHAPPAAPSRSGAGTGLRRGGPPLYGRSGSRGEGHRSPAPCRNCPHPGGLKMEDANPNGALEQARALSRFAAQWLERVK